MLRAMRPFVPRDLRPSADDCDLRVVRRHAACSQPNMVVTSSLEMA
jgi:hypothetical protein